jgi:hypothetical protein
LVSGRKKAAMAAKMLIPAKKKKTPPCLRDRTMLGVNRETMRFQSHWVDDAVERP